MIQLKEKMNRNSLKAGLYASAQVGPNNNFSINLLSYAILNRSSPM